MEQYRRDQGSEKKRGQVISIKILNRCTQENHELIKPFTIFFSDSNSISMNVLMHRKRSEKFCQRN